MTRPGTQKTRGNKAQSPKEASKIQSERSGLLTGGRGNKGGRQIENIEDGLLSLLPLGRVRRSYIAKEKLLAYLLKLLNEVGLLKLRWRPFIDREHPGRIRHRRQAK